MILLLFVLILFTLVMCSIHWDDIAQNYRYKTTVDIEKIRSLLKVTIGIMNDNNIPYFVAEGTLLGIIRDGDLIKWDTDGDIIVINQDKFKLLNIIQENLPPGYILSVGCCQSRIIEPVKNNFVDIFFYETTSSGKVQPCSHLHRWSDTYFSWLSNFFAMSSFQTKDIFPLKQMNWDGVAISIPNNVDRVLETQYGSSWKTPIKRKEWENFLYYKD